MPCREIENMNGTELTAHIASVMKKCPAIMDHGVAVIYTPPTRGVGLGHMMRARAIAEQLPNATLRSSELLLSGDLPLNDELAVVMDVYPDDQLDVLEALYNYNVPPAIIGLERQTAEIDFYDDVVDIADCSRAWAIVDSYVQQLAAVPRTYRLGNPVVVRCGSTDAAKNLTNGICDALHAADLPHLRCVDYIEKNLLADAIARAPLAIINAGVLLNEALALGTPALVIPQTELERVAAAQYVPSDGVYALTSELALSPGVVCAIAAHLLSRDHVTWDGISHDARLVDGMGARRVAALAVELAAKQAWTLSRLPDGPL